MDTKTASTVESPSRAATWAEARTRSPRSVTIGVLQSTRRHLLVVTGAATATAACSASPDAVPLGGMDGGSTTGPMDDPFLGLDGGLPQAAQSGTWQGPVPGVDVGAVTDFAAGTWVFNAGARAVIALDAMGLYAYSAICTHERCLLHPPDTTGVAVCPCHGSRFDGNGHRMDGPAVTDLRHYAVAVALGRVWVDVSSRVADSARTSLPVDAGMPMDAAVHDATAMDTGPVDTGPVDTGVDVDPCTVGTDVGAVTSFAVGSWTLLSRPRVVVARDTHGIFAYSATCTHAGCTIGAPDATGVAHCPCHGSQFDGVGHVVMGPAADPLSHYACTVCAGRLHVDTGTLVADSARVVP